MSLFKYTEKRFADDFMKGQIYIPNMQSYHNVELLGDAVGDREEATDIQILSGQYELGKDEIPGISSVPGAKVKVNLIDTTFVTAFSDLYSFCLSTECSKYLMNRFSEMNEKVGKPPYDVCLEIVSTGRFRRRLRKLALEQHKLIYFTENKCNYRKTIGNSPVRNPQLEPRHFLEKPPELTWQQEYRFGFVLSKEVNSIEPFYIIKSPELSVHFTEISLA